MHYCYASRRKKVKKAMKQGGSNADLLAAQEYTYVPFARVTKRGDGESCDASDASNGVEFYDFFLNAVDSHC
ncbi:hypothetical protein L596_026265 [Steinernema carpocapsae]|uniref:Uncharacterized protein n=1 Tax=Steinernema carpocapsae TaxID=34508 RepID=A0A4U5M0V8_STECR|nr:hypothetical protein L596_026265 [Steinernema carpocapsae]